MPKSIRHNPRAQMKGVERERIDAMEIDLLKMTPEQAENWVKVNVKTLPEMKALVCNLVKAVNALAYEVRRPK